MTSLLTIIQIIAILQGLFLAVILFKRRQEYKNPRFWLFMGCIISVILFSFGDDNYNLFIENASWFYFHEPLMVTFFFLFIRYSNSKKNEFNKVDTLFFLPYIVNLILEFLKNLESFRDNSTIDFLAEIIEIGFIGMLIYSIVDVLKNDKEKWLLAFLIPFALIFTYDELTPIFIETDNSKFAFDSYGTILIAVFLFYFVTYRLIISPKEVLPVNEIKYKASTLSKNDAENIIKSLDKLMVEEKIFKNQKIDASQVADKLGISRQRLSEVLNVHLGIRFQDYLNHHRVEEFIRCIKKEEYKNLTLLGIATEVGFSSKSSFNATFKKIKGMTPSEYKKSNF